MHCIGRFLFHVMATKNSAKIRTMLQRFAIHIAFVFLFVFSQIGVATHEISHVVDAAKHTQHDKNTTAEQCEQCLSYAKIASGLPLSAFAILKITSQSTTVACYHACSLAVTFAAYAARAPPQITSL